MKKRILVISTGEAELKQFALKINEALKCMIEAVEYLEPLTHNRFKELSDNVHGVVVVVGKHTEPTMEDLKGIIVTADTTDSFNRRTCTRSMPTREEIELLIDNLPQYETLIKEKPFNEIKSQKDYRRKADKRNFNHYRQ